MKRINEMEKIKVNGKEIRRIQVMKDDQLQGSVYMELIKRDHYLVLSLNDKGTVLSSKRIKGSYKAAKKELYDLGDELLRN